MPPAPIGPPRSLPLRTLEFRDAWSRLLDRETLRFLTSGVDFPLADAMRPSAHPEYAGARSLELRAALLRLREQGIISRFSHPRPIFNLVFPVEKGGGGIRPVIAATAANLWSTPRPAPLPTVLSFAASLSPGEWMCSLDIAKAFYHLRLAPRARRAFMFRLDGEPHAFVGLPMGWRQSPGLLHNLLDPVIRFLGSHLIRCLRYVDDMGFSHRHRETLGNQLAWTLRVFAWLGISINLAKSQLTPTTRLRFLGYLIDSRAMTVTPSSERRRAITRDARDALQGPITAKVAMRLAGRLASLCTVIPLADFCRHAILRDIWRSLRGLYVPSSPVTLSDTARRDLQILIEAPPSLWSRPLRPSTPEWVLTTDAAASGWGGFVVQPDGTHSETRGTWPADDRRSSNRRELEGVILSIRALVLPTIPDGAALHVRTDNTTARSYVQRLGGRVEPLHQLVRPLAETLLRRRISVRATHLPGIENERADRLSRIPAGWNDFVLTPLSFQSLSDRWGVPEVDLCAEPHNAKTAIFISRFPCHQARGCDLLSVPWHHWRHVYLFPPLPLLPQVLERIRRFRGSTTLILPPWASGPVVTALLQGAKETLLLPVEAIQPPRRDFQWTRHPATAILWRNTA